MPKACYDYSKYIEKESWNAEGPPDRTGRYDREIPPLRGYLAIVQLISIIISTLRVSIIPPLIRILNLTPQAIFINRNFLMPIIW
jgi:hypothetical protein